MSEQSLFGPEFQLGTKTRRGRPKTLLTPLAREKEREAIRNWQKTERGKSRTSDATRRYLQTAKGLDRSRTAAKRNAAKIKYECFGHYPGGTPIPHCVCCGESDFAFLTLAHVNNDGAKHRRATMGARGIGGHRFYQYLRKRCYPNDPPLELQCFNCNCGARSNNGVCPHKTKKKQESA